MQLAHKQLNYWRWSQTCFVFFLLCHWAPEMAKSQDELHQTFLRKQLTPWALFPTLKQYHFWSSPRWKYVCICFLVWYKAQIISTSTRIRTWRLERKSGVQGLGPGMQSAESDRVSRKLSFITEKVARVHKATHRKTDDFKSFPPAS